VALFVFRATHLFLVRCARSCAKVGTGVADAGARDIARRIREWFHWAPATKGGFFLNGFIEGVATLRTLFSQARFR